MSNLQDKLNYKHTEESKQKMRGRARSAEHSNKLSDSLKGKPWSEARIQAQLRKQENKNG
jgi:hypothetical protein